MMNSLSETTMWGMLASAIKEMTTEEEKLGQMKE
jgi:hypothetical protein